MKVNHWIQVWVSYYYNLKIFTSCLDILKKEPTLADFLKIFVGYEHQYVSIGASLDVNVADIVYNAATQKNSLSSVFERWIKKHKDVTWNRVMQVCEDFPDDFGKVKSSLEEYLSSEEARKKYLDKK